MNKEEEEHVSNLNGSEAAGKIKELAEGSRTCMMLTNLEKRPFSARPMTVLKADDAGQLFFFSAKDSAADAEIKASSDMHLIFANEGRSEYLSIYGKANVYRDQQQIDELYSFFANVYFEGKDDPNITIIRFRPESGHFWDAKHGRLVQLAGMIYGAVTGKQTNDGIEGDLNV